MRTSIKVMLWTGILGAVSLLGSGTPAARAQGYYYPAARAQTSPVYYYPASGNYATTLGTVYIPAPGYYYNVPRYAVQSPSNPVAVRRASFTDPAQAGYYWVPTSYPIGRSSHISTRDVEENPGWQFR